MSRACLPSRRWAGLKPVTVAVGLTFLSASVIAALYAADIKDPRPGDRQVTLSVATLLKQEHLTKHPIDVEMSRKFLDTYLKTLDPMKIYFLQSDIDEFKKEQDRLGDAIKKGDISFGYTVFHRFLQRVDADQKIIDELLATKHDFTVDETMVTDPKKLNYPKDEAEARERWRKRIKYDLLVQKADKTADADVKDKLTRRYHSFAKRMHQTDGDELLEMYLTSLTTSFDPHTTYMSPSSLENFEIQMRLNLEGIGAALQFDDGFTKVSKLIPGGAAEKDGHLKPEDRVVGVGQGENGDIVDTAELNLTDVVKLIRGKKGTVVRLKVIPVGAVEPKIYNITRASIELKDSEARSEIFEEGKKPDGTPYKIGVIDLPSFYMDMEGAREGVADYKSTTRDVRKLLNDFTSKHVDAVIIDLRRDGGGSLTEAISLTGLFIDEGPVVQVKDSEGKIQIYKDEDRGVAWGGPLVVLDSKFSASASEIFAGAIQDYHRGLIVGDHSTHGKGTVQSLLDLGRQLFRVPNAPAMGALKVTMQQFYRPNGDSTQEKGVESDVELPSLTTHLDVGEKDLDNHLKFDHIPAAQIQMLNMVNDPIKHELQKHSADRVQASDDFKKVDRNIARYEEQKKRQEVSLNEEKFLKDRSEMNSDKEEEKELKELDDPNRPVVKKDFYFNEVLAITLDYLQSNKVASTN